MMRRILHITGSLVRGGTESFIMNHLRTLDKDDYCCDFLILNKDYINAYVEEIEKLGGRIFSLSESPRLKNALSIIREIRRIIAANGPYHVIHCHSDLGNVYGLFAATMERIPIRVSHCHGAPPENNKSLARGTCDTLIRWIIRKCATDYLACSAQAGSYLYGATRFSKQGKIINNGIDVSALNNVSADQIDQIRNQYDIPENVLVIGNITRFDDNKNQEFILRIFKRLLVRTEALLVLGGVDGGFQQRIINLTHEMGISNSVRFIGARDDIPVWMKILDVYVFPSRHEGFGMAVIEAQACNTPCVASNVLPLETDVGLITYLELKQPEDEWVNAILSMSGKNMEPADIPKVFSQKGLDITGTARTLEKIYGRNLHQ